MNLLIPQDFELLVDLVFSNSGWRHVGQLGKTQKIRNKAFAQVL